MSLSGIMAGAAYIKLTMNDAQAVQALDRTKSNLKSFAAAASSAGDTLTLVAAPLSVMIDRYIKFSDTMLQVKAVSDASGKQLANLRKQAGDLGRTTAFTSTQVAQGMVELARMGFTAEEVSQAIRPAMNLVRSTGEEMWRLGEFAEYTASILRIFNLSAKEFGKVADVMAMAANKSSVDIADLGMSLKIVGPSAKAMGESLESTTSLLMTLADTGIRGSEAGTMLRRVFQAIAEQSAEGKETAKHLRDLGVELKTSSGKARSARDIFVDLTKKMQAMSDIEKVNFSVDVFDLRGSAAALNLVEFSSKLRNFENDLSDAAGYAEKKAKEMEAEFGGVVREMKSAVQELGLAMSGSFAKNLTPFIAGVTGAVKDIENFIRESSVGIGVLTKFMLVVGGVGGALKAAFAIGKGVSSLFDPVRKLDAMLRGSKEASAANLAKKESKNALLIENYKIAVAKRADAEKAHLESQAALREKTQASMTAAFVEQAEERKLAAIKKRYAEDAANNQKNLLQQSLDTKGVLGKGDTPEITASAKAVKDQEKVLAKAVAARQKLAKEEDVLRQQVVKRAAAMNIATAAQETAAAPLSRIYSLEKKRKDSLTRLLVLKKNSALTDRQQTHLYALLHKLKVKDIALSYQQARASKLMARVMALLKKAQLSVAAGFRAIDKAIAANPIGAILTAISLAATAISYVIGKIDEARSKALGLAQTSIDKAKEGAQEGKGKRQAAREQMRGLTQLAEISKEVELTADQMREAENLIKDMDWAGASEWAKLDKTAKKLTIVKDKMEEMTKAKSVANAIAEQQKVIDTAKKAIEDISYKTVRSAVNERHGTGPVVERVKRTNYNDEEKQSLETWKQQIIKAEALMKKYKALDMDAIMGLDKTQSERNDEREQQRLATAKELEKAKEEMLKLDQEVADANKTSTQKEIDAINEKASAYLNYYDIVIAKEEQLRKLAAQSGDKEKAKQHQQNIKNYKNQLRAVSAWRKSQISAAYQKRNKEWETYEENKKAQEAKKAQDRKQWEWERKLKKLQDKGKTSEASQFVKTEYERLKKVIAEMNAKRDAMEKSFKSSLSEEGIGLSTDEKGKLGKMEQEISPLEARAEELRRMMLNINDDMTKNPPQERLQAVGSWSLKNLSMALGGGTAAEQTAYNTKESVKLQKKTNKALDEMKKNNFMTFGA